MKVRVTQMSSDTQINKNNDFKEAFLISLNSGYEADLVKGSLQSAGIPFYTKEHSGPAGFARYDTKYKKGDVDFYVPTELLIKAKAALPPVTGAEELQKELSENETLAEDAPETDKTGQETEKEPPKLMSHGMRILFVILFIAVCCGVVFGVDTLMNYLRSLMGY